MKALTKRLGVLSIGIAVMAGTNAMAGSWIEYGTCEESRSEVLIEGTSTLHPWTVRGRSIEGTVRLGEGFPVTASGGAGETDALPVEGQLAVPSGELRSFRGGRPYSDRMDNIMYEKLQVEDHPQIVFELKSLDWAEPGGGDEEGGHFVAEGELTIAGVTGDVAVPVTVTELESGRLKFSGKVEMKMTDFEIDPPRAMGGMIRTGDEITVRVDWIVAKVE